MNLTPYLGQITDFDKIKGPDIMQIPSVPLPRYEMTKHLKARETLYNLSLHPAIPDVIPGGLLSLIDIDISLVCKNGYTEPFRDGCIEIHFTLKNYKKYKEEFDKEFKEYTSEELKREKVHIRVDVPYKKVYGYPWKANHIEYWGEICFMLFSGKIFKIWHHSKDWQRCSGVSASGRTFEEMVVNLGEKFFKKFGKFTNDDFLTKAEKRNYKKEPPFFFVPVEHKKHKASRMVSNPKHKTIYVSEINRRWALWFSKTPFGKKHWDETIRDAIAGTM